MTPQMNADKSRLIHRDNRIDKDKGKSFIIPVHPVIPVNSFFYLWSSVVNSLSYFRFFRVFRAG